MSTAGVKTSLALLVAPQPGAPKGGKPSKARSKAAAGGPMATRIPALQQRKTLLAKATAAAGATAAQMRRRNVRQLLNTASGSARAAALAAKLAAAAVKR